MQGIAKIFPTVRHWRFHTDRTAALIQLEEGSSVRPRTWHKLGRWPNDPSTLQPQVFKGELLPGGNKFATPHQMHPKGQTLNSGLFYCPQFHALHHIHQLAQGGRMALTYKHCCVCNSRFASRTPHGRFCSGLCRVRNHRTLKQAEQDQPTPQPTLTEEEHEHDPNA